MKQSVCKILVCVLLLGLAGCGSREPAVTQPSIAQVKRKLGMEVRENYNLSKQESPRRSHCTPEQEEAIIAALKHFGMLANE